MDRFGFAGLPWVARCARNLADALSGVAELLELRGNTEARLRFEAEVREFVSPALPVLMHKRARLLGGAGERTVLARRWLAELDLYVDRILLPMLKPKSFVTWRDHARMTGLIDAMIDEAAAGKGQGVQEQPPVTWRVDTGWAV